VRTDGRTDGQNKASHNISPAHSAHLADIITFKATQGYRYKIGRVLSLLIISGL